MDGWIQVNENLSIEKREYRDGIKRKETRQGWKDGWMDGCCHGDNLRILLITGTCPILSQQTK